MKLPENETRRHSQSRRKFRCCSAGNTGPLHYGAFEHCREPAAMLFGRGGCGYSVGERKRGGRGVRGEPTDARTQTASLATPSMPPWRRPSGHCFLNEPSRPRASASTSSRSMLPISPRSSFCCSRSPISSGNPLTPTNGHATRSPYSRANTTRPTTPGSSRSDARKRSCARRRRIERRQGLDRRSHALLRTCRVAAPVGQ